MCSERRLRSTSQTRVNTRGIPIQRTTDTQSDGERYELANNAMQYAGQAFTKFGSTIYSLMYHVLSTMPDFSLC